MKPTARPRVAFCPNSVAWLLPLVMTACSGTDGTPSTETGGTVANIGGNAAMGGNTGVPGLGGTAAGGQSATTLVTGSGGTTTPQTNGLGGSSNGLGGAVTTGGAITAGGSSAVTSTIPTGGSTTTAKGGSTSTGGTTAKGGSSSLGGSTAKGGSTSTGGTTAKGGSTSTGGTTAKGGTTSLGGTTAKGGTTSTGGATDRCDVGIYDAASPPKTLTLSGGTQSHDPTALFSGSTYYVYDTGLGAKTSTNLTAWTYGSSPLATPSWMQTALPNIGNLWAPDLAYFNNQNHLYYAGSDTFGQNKSCIGHATRASMTSGSWADQGSAVICSTTSNNWNAIDPSVILDTNGTPWMAFGSFWSGIQIVQLTADGTARANSTVTLIAGRGGSGVEGPALVRRCGYYYLFTSWDKCCDGVNSTYNIRVGRSTTINGGYVDKNGTALASGGGTLITQGNGTTFAGPGGQSVLVAGNKAYLVYHAYAIPSGTPTLRIADLVWDSSGWPVAVGP